MCLTSHSLTAQIEWGGGSSVENPHFQRLHYCKLLIADFLQRLPSGRFPSVAADMKVRQRGGILVELCQCLRCSRSDCATIATYACSLLLTV